jgi:beta-phosphoglucomutase-like phosphatase (HAD superfamily)
VTVAVLDFDGTLVDANYHHAIAWYRAFRQHEIVLPIEEAGAAGVFESVVELCEKLDQTPLR